MFGYRFKLFTLFGFPVRIDVSWFLIVILITWSLAVGLFPHFIEGLHPATYWAMGVAGALGLFISIVAHEFAHAIVARGYGIPMKGITLFIFGGVAEMEDEPPSGRAEFFVAIAGPIASILVAVLGFGLWLVGLALEWPAAANGVLAYLGWINLVLVIFNMIPAFPLDGGRVLRAALWSWKGSLRWATRISSTIGSGFGLALIVLGALAFISGNFVGGMWWFLIGLFLRGAAQMSYQQVLIRRAIEGEPVSRFMHPEPHTVSPGLNLAELVEDHVYRTHHKMFPVTEDDGRLLGCVTTRQIREVPREQWSARTVRDVMLDCSSDNTISPDEDAIRALSRMQQTGASRLMVVADGELVGILSIKDLIKFISLKIELEEDGHPDPRALAAADPEP